MREIAIRGFINEKYNTPFGKGLFGKKIGETAEIQAPAGVVEVEILEITR
jgi:transcription elongation factor GreA